MSLVSTYKHKISNAFISKQRFSNWRPWYLQLHWTDFNETKCNRRRIVTILAWAWIIILNKFFLFFYTKLQKKSPKWIFHSSMAALLSTKNQKIMFEVHARMASILIITPFYFSFQTTWKREIVAASTTPFFGPPTLTAENFLNSPHIKAENIFYLL